MRMGEHHSGAEGGNHKSQHEHRSEIGTKNGVKHWRKTLQARSLGARTLTKWDELEIIFFCHNPVSLSDSAAN
jgi:hypothetical protein